MPTFSYKALDQNGREISDSIDLTSRDAVIDKIISDGLSPVSVDENKETASSSKTFSRTGRISKSDIEAFTRELANLLTGGVPLSRSLSILGREASNPAAKTQWSAIKDCVADGMSLADAFAKFPKSFSNVYVAMVRAGEAGGFLDIVLDQIASFQSRERKLIGKVKAATIYPIILAVLGIMIMIFLMTFFIPRFSSIFNDFGGALPTLTLFIIGASDFLVKYWLIILMAVVSLFVVFKRTMSKSEGRRVIEGLLLKTPLIGKILARFALVRFSRMLGTLAGADVPLVTALNVASEAIGNQVLSDALIETVKKVRNGSSLSAGMSGCPQLFPSSVVEMISVAEASGRLDKELVRLSETYEEDLDRRLGMLVAQAEPALLFLMAIVVGTVIMGMLLPIFNLQELIR
ncbi:type II secretion system F family protein [Thermodesulfobacteriota bacterium]